MWNKQFNHIKYDDTNLIRKMCFLCAAFRNVVELKAGYFMSKDKIIWLLPFRRVIKLRMSIIAKYLLKKKVWTYDYNYIPLQINIKKSAGQVSVVSCGPSDWEWIEEVTFNKWHWRDSLFT